MAAGDAECWSRWRVSLDSRRHEDGGVHTVPTLSRRVQHCPTIRQVMESKMAAGDAECCVCLDEILEPVHSPHPFNTLNARTVPR